MYDSELFQTGKSLIEDNLGVRQLFRVLPENAEISVQLDDRAACTLVCQNDHVALLPQPSRKADIEVILFSESIRRLSESPPDDLVRLAKELVTLSLVGAVKVRTLSSPKSLYEKGYVHALKNLGPELQKDLMKYAFMLMGQAQQAATTLKTLLKK